MKVISGGQTGADQAGLAAAKELGLETGGWMPHGWRTDSGPAPEIAKLYGLQEHASPLYPPRTECNVVESDATIIFGNDNSPGCRLTKRLCDYHMKPYMLTPRTGSVAVAAALVRGWLRAGQTITGREVKVLNIAGNRERTNPGIFEWTKKVLLEALK